MTQWAQPEPYLHAGRIGTLAEHLGRRIDEKLVIVNADDFGLTEGANRTAVDLFHEGLVSSTTVMMTGAACESGLGLLRSTGIDCGVHLTLTSSLPQSPASPISGAATVTSLLNEAGEFYFDRNKFFESAKPDQAMTEAVAQIESAISNGLSISHIDSHEGTLQLRSEFAAVYVELALKYALPVRMGSRALLHQLGLPAEWIEKLRGAGLHFPDNLLYIPIDHFESLDEKIMITVSLIESLPAGVTELFFHPLNPDYLDAQISDSDQFSQYRIWDYQLLTSRKYQSALADIGAQLISFAPLRELCRQSQQDGS